MMQTPISPPPAASAAAPDGKSGPAVGTPLPQKRFTLAPNWLQVTLIAGLLSAAVFVALNGRYLWSLLLAIAGICFGASYVLRRMVGDDYDRS